MAEKRTTKKQAEVTPEVKVAPEEAALETTATTPDGEETEVLANGEITEVEDVEVPEELTEADERIQELADATEGGAYGSGRERMIALGSDYGAVQAELTKRYRNRNR